MEITMRAGWMICRLAAAGILGTLLVIPLRSQEQAPPDSAKPVPGFLAPGLSGVPPQFSIPPMFITGYQPRPGIYLPALEITQPYRFGSYHENIDLAAAWKLELEGQDRMKLINLMLGTAVLGGAGYVAYEHVRKYGF